MLQTETIRRRDAARTAAPATRRREQAGARELPDLTGARSSPERVPAAAGRLHRGCRAALWLAFFLVTVRLTLLGFERYTRYTANSYDLGIFAQAVWLIAHGRVPFVTVRGLHIMGDHWTPVLYLLAPFYRLLPDPRLLIAVQALVMAAGVFPLYQLALRRAKRPDLALLVAGSYLCHPSLWGMAAFDFHPSSLAVTPLLFAVDALDAGRPPAFLASCVLALICKEDVALSVILLGGLAYLRGQKRTGAIVAAGSGIWMVICLRLMAHLAHATSSSYWSLYGPILDSLHSGPIAVAQAVLQKLAFPLVPNYLLVLLLPAGLIAFAAPELLLVAVPALLSNLLSNRFTMQEIGFQYDVVPLAMLYAATAVGLPRVLSWLEEVVEIRRLVGVRGPLPSNLRARSGAERARFTAAALLGVSAVFGLICYTPRVVLRFFSQELSPAQARARDQVLALIPRDAGVVATNRVLPHLANRSQIYLFPNPMQEDCWGSSAQALDQQMGLSFTPLGPHQFWLRLQQRGPEFIVLQSSGFVVWPLRRLQFRDLSAAVLSCPSYGITAVGGDLILLKRGAGFYSGFRLLGAPVAPGMSPESIRTMMIRAWRNE